MKIEKIFPETLLELIRKELDKRSCFEYIEGVQPFLMKYDNSIKTRERPVNRHFTALYELRQKLRCNNNRKVLN